MSVESCPLKGTPWVIPDIMLRFLTDLDSDQTQPRPSWTIQKDGHGLSLTVKFAAQSRTCSKQRNYGKTVPGTSEKANSSETIIPRRKKKSPSTTRRNRLRKKAWIQKGKSARLLARSTDSTSKVVHVAEGNSPNTDHNGTESEPIPVTTPSHQDQCSYIATNELETEQLCKSVPTCEIANSDIIDLPSDSKTPAEYEWGNLCAYCKVPSLEDDQFKRCTGCKFVRYCSKTCQVAHWKVHRAGCKILQAGPGCVT